MKLDRFQKIRTLRNVLITKSYIFNRIKIILPILKKDSSKESEKKTQKTLDGIVFILV